MEFPFGTIPFSRNSGINPVVSWQLTDKHTELDALDQYLGNVFGRGCVMKQINRPTQSLRKLITQGLG